MNDLDVRKVTTKTLLVMNEYERAILANLLTASEPPTDGIWRQTYEGLRKKFATRLICDICHEGFLTLSHGNNAAPVVPGGRCCDHCDTHVVVPRRIREVLV